jgi:hypothetical protein
MNLILVSFTSYFLLANIETAWRWYLIPKHVADEF